MPWHGLPELYAALDKIVSRADTVARELVVTGSALVTREAQANFHGAHRTGEPHVGGNQPNIVSGDLRRSIRPDTVRAVGTLQYSTQIGPRMVYGRAVELGYLTRRPFPYFQPAVDHSLPQLRQLAFDGWSKLTHP